MIVNQHNPTITTVITVNTRRLTPKRNNSDQEVTTTTNAMHSPPRSASTSHQDLQQLQQKNNNNDNNPNNKKRMTAGFAITQSPHHAPWLPTTFVLIRRGFHLLFNDVSVILKTTYLKNQSSNISTLSSIGLG